MTESLEGSIDNRYNGGGRYGGGITTDGPQARESSQLEPQQPRQNAAAAAAAPSSNAFQNETLLAATAGERFPAAIPESTRGF